MTVTDAEILLAREEVRRTPWSGSTAVSHWVFKRTVDVAVALTVLLLALPVLLAIALLVRRDGGPVLFRQDRVGRNGRLFGMYKFRSMAEDAEERLRSDPELHQQYVANGFKLPAESDPRVTHLGRILRATSLDEIPQLLNVLRGEMSIVGPRPIVEDELTEYRVRGGERAYLSARPGMTGLWQTSGRSLVGYDQRVEMDKRYVERSSVRTDISIMFRTVTVVMRREGAH
jgi:lipopolysaccharide/colanic/teichoic acid biosynthesis glycosyltransferase